MFELIFFLKRGRLKVIFGTYYLNNHLYIEDCGIFLKLTPDFSHLELNSIQASSTSFVFACPIEPLNLFRI
jgi:hypothetical protein